MTESAKPGMTVCLSVSLTVMIAVHASAFAQISFDESGRWKTSFDCPEWDQADDWSNLECNDLIVAGAWTCSDDFGEHGGQITADAQNPLSRGGRGFRHWQGDGNNNNSGGINIVFDSPQPEFWIRWYHRYEAGFQWSETYGRMPHYDKILYIWTEKPHNAIFPSHPSGDRWRIATQAPSGAAASAEGIGWQYTMGGEQSDGEFHVHEAYVKMDTDGTDGIARLWIDGELIVESFEMNYSGGTDSEEDQTARNGWVRILVGSNQNEPDNGRCMYVDYDDIVIYNRTPPNVDEHGNPWIGPTRDPQENGDPPDAGLGDADPPDGDAGAGNDETGQDASDSGCSCRSISPAPATNRNSISEGFSSFGGLRSIALFGGFVLYGVMSRKKRKRKRSFVATW